VDVVIVNWNGRHHLEQCIPALHDQSLPPERVIVVDNGSADDSLQWLARNAPDATVIEAGANLGFAAGNNLGLVAGSAPLVALLNADTTPAADWLAALVAAIADDDRVGSVASKMIFKDRPGIVNSTGIAVDPAGIAWDRLGGAAADSPAANQTADVFGASAGAGLYRRAALADVAEPIGGARLPFDPAFFMYLEDVDLAWRLRLRGWRSVFAPEALVAHEGSGTAGEGSAFKNRLLARNKVWTLVKNYPSDRLARRLPAIVAYDLASVPYRVVVNGQTAALRGRLDALGGLVRAWRQRWWIQARRTASWHEIAAVMEPWATPWAVAGRYRHLRAPTG
jgi:GT2 family glycosyltransferase